MTPSTTCANQLRLIPPRYTGKERDSESGNDYFGARYYNPVTGRFMSRDPNNPNVIGPDKIPIDPRMLHKYLYAEGDPVDVIDPRGKASILETGSLDITIARTAPEVLQFGGSVACAFTVDAYVISLLNGANPIDATLGGAGTAGGCALAALGYFF